MAFTGCASGQLPADGGQWSTYKGDYARMNLSQAKTSVPLIVAWDKDVSEFKLLRPHPKEELSSPAIANGRLYAGSAANVLYATDLASGKVYWKFNASSPIEAPPTVTPDRVYFGSADGLMRALDLDGKLIWQYQARSEVLSSPVVKDGKVFFSSSDDRIHALDAATGERLWTYSRGVYKTVTPRLYASPALTANGNLIHLFSDGAVVCVSAGTGKEVWTKKMVKEFNESVPPRRTPLADSGAVYLIDGSGAVVALSEETGDVKGIYNTIKAKDFVIPDSRSIIIAGEEQVMAIDRTTGAQLWQTRLAHGPVASTASSGAYMFVLSNFKKAPLGIEWFAKDRGHIEAIRLSDGVASWSREFDSTLSAEASSAYERLALITNDGQLTVLGPK